MAELLESIGHNVRRLREEKGWNQTELGFYAETSPSIISLIENGKRNPSTATLAKIAGALGVEVADLFPKAQQPLLPEITDEQRAARHNFASIYRSNLLGDAWLLEKAVEASRNDQDELLRISEICFDKLELYLMEEDLALLWCDAEKLTQLIEAESAFEKTLERLDQMLGRARTEDARPHFRALENVA
ncbi:MAG: helix-turn-helix domain-containing protein [Actinomycetota bacterium]|nr:helix-turn-helix domain-containing protein [Actinomycetota bacterium]